MMVVQLGAKPLAGFTEPIEMLKDCHRRIEHFIDVLRTVERRFGETGLDEDARRALESSLNYFAHFAPRHTADEEQSLFPRLRRSQSSDAQAVMAELQHLEHDHRRCEEGHALIDRIVHQWLAADRLDEVQRKRLRAALDALATVYAAHIQLEEQRVFAIASQILKPEQLREIGAEMKQRRSLTH